MNPMLVEVDELTVVVCFGVERHTRVYSDINDMWVR